MKLLAASALVLPLHAAATRNIHTVSAQVLNAVQRAWSRDDVAELVGTVDQSALANALTSGQGTISLSPVSWSGSSSNPLVSCTGCSFTADLSLAYNLSVVDGAVEYFSAMLVSTGSMQFAFDANIPNATLSPQVEPVTSFGPTTTNAALGGSIVSVSVSTDIDTSIIAAAVEANPPTFSGSIVADITSHSGFVFTPTAGLRLIADETTIYTAESFTVHGNTDSALGFAAHVALAVSHRVDLSSLASFAAKIEPALQGFSAPGTEIVSGDDFFYSQAFLCLFDGDCPYDEICVSSGECISYQHEGGPTYCEFNDCIGGDPGCDVEYPNCAGQRTCSNDNCRIFHTHGDNLDKYNALCCGVDQGADTASYCEFESVNHVFWFEDLPYYDYNDPGYDDFTPLQVAIANAESIVCGMGAPEDCVQIDKIVPYEGGYSVGMVVAATVARNCHLMELYVMREYGCFDTCDTIGALSGLFHGTSASKTSSSGKLRRRLDQHDADRQAAHARRQLQGPLDEIAINCPETDVVNFAMRIGGAASVSPLVSNTGTVISADDSQLRAHVEPVEWGCIADEIASSEDLELLTMPVIAQDGAVWAGDLRYVGPVTDQLNGDGYCSEHFGFGPHEWAAGLSGGFDFATLSFQVNSTTDPLSRVPVYHTRMLMNWGSLPRNDESDEAALPFGCNVDTTADLEIDLRVGSVVVTEASISSAKKRSCWSTTSSYGFRLPSSLSFTGVLDAARGNVLNVTDQHRCWQATLTNKGNNPLAQAACHCDVGYWRPTCEVTEDDGTHCKACSPLPDFHYYTSDGGSFWNGCTFEACVDDCGIGNYRKDCGGDNPGYCVPCTLESSQPFISSGPFTDSCETEAEIVVAQMSTELTAGVITASIIAVAVLVALVVLAVFLVMKKRQDRLNDVHSALRLTSRSVKAPDEDDGDGNHERTTYDSFQTDADIIID